MIDLIVPRGDELERIPVGTWPVTVIPRRCASAVMTGTIDGGTDDSGRLRASGNRS